MSKQFSIDGSLELSAPLLSPSPPSLSVVGLSGSSDSVALTYLAKQNFDKVLAMTVNLKLVRATDEQKTHTHTHTHTTQYE